MRSVLFALASVLALGACFSPVEPPGQTLADTGPAPLRDAGTAVCAKDLDCPTPPSTPCSPVAGFCDRGTCAVKPLPTVWQNNPGACEIAEHCKCQELDGPDCVGEWQCLSGRCSFECSQSGCESDRECPSGQNCFADCQGVMSCQAGCHEASDCPAGKVCFLPGPFCGDPIGVCQDGPSCSADAHCPAGTVCDFPDLEGGARRCVAGCHEDAQCGDGQVCAITMCFNCPDCPCYGQCQPKGGCELDAQCPAGTVCATEQPDCQKRCLPGCHQDSDCRPDEACAPPPPCVGCGCDHGTCYPKPTGCASDSECAQGQVCANLQTMECGGERTCVAGCWDDADCGTDQTCLRSYCGPCCPGTCETVAAGCKSDAECGFGLVCEGCGTGPKSCVPGCRDAFDCKVGESCEQVVCDSCPCPAQCAPTTAGCKADADCGSGRVCEPGPGCVGPNQCVEGCHNDSQCANGGRCWVEDDCLTCPCPGSCSAPACFFGEPACSSQLQCAWGTEMCQAGCCQACPAPPPYACPADQCTFPGGRDTNGCTIGSTCGPCCKCGPGTPVCGENYGTYASECEATCAGVKVLHAGACLPYEGMACDWNGGGCSAAMYCRDPCPMCGSIQQLRCTQIGACVFDWDCPAGLASPACADGQPPMWKCANHACLASCPP